MYRFDEDSHTYWHGEIRIPSVSEIIPAPEFFVSDERLEECRLEGEDMHSRIKLYHDTRETWGDPLLVALERWEREHKELGKLLKWEEPLSHPTLHYGGTPDMIFEYELPDFKRQYGNSRRHALQLVLYIMLARANKIIDDSRRLLILTFDGEEIKQRDVSKYRADAEQIALELVAAWWARRNYEIYMTPKRRTV